jgi:uncharacterized protein (DUF2384 family)
MDRRERVAALENRAVEMLGKSRAERWIYVRNRGLSHLTPIELAETSEAGYRIAVSELEKQASALNTR